jgi:hypothetical protein
MSDHEKCNADFNAISRTAEMFCKERDEALARIAELEDALLRLLTADEDPIPPHGNSIVAWAERLAAARQNARRLLTPAPQAKEAS